MKRHQKIKGRHEQVSPDKFQNVFRYLPTWGKLLAVIGMALVSGLVLLVSLSAYFSDSVSGTVEVKIPQYYFTVNFESNGGSAVPSVEVKADTAIPEPAKPTKTGYDFVSWHRQSDFSDTAWNFTTNKMPRQNLTLHAKWQAQTYNITYDLDGGTNGANPATYTYDVGVTSFAPATRTGYTFDGWYDDATGGNPVTSISKTDTGNKRLYARWTPDEYTITYNLNGGGTNHQDNPGKYTYGIGVASFKDATRSGYKFLGWFDKSSGGAKITEISTTATGVKTLYARWQQVYTISFKNFNGSASVLDSVEVAPGSNLPIPDAPVKANEYFLGWATAKSPANTETLYVPTSYTDIRLSLGVLDNAHLGYAVKSASPSALSNIQANQTLYAVYYKQRTAVTKVGDEFIWLNSIWRTLDTDMDNKASNGLQALVIKVTDIGSCQFLIAGSTYKSYFDSSVMTDGSNGYEDSRSAGGVGKVIDNWYNTNIKGKAAEAFVQAVALNNPTYTEFTKTPFTFDRGSRIGDWQWNNYYRDTRFATTLTGSVSKQAFALSYGDIYGHMGVGTTATSTSLFDFTYNGGFWLRSAGENYRRAGVIYVASLQGDGQVYNTVNSFYARPALSLSIQ